jgi:hypothetical protein
MESQQGTPRSFLEQLLEFAIGMVGICVFLFVGYWTVIAIHQAWPISLYTIVALIPLIAFWKTQNLLGKALVATLKPIVLGLGAVFLLALSLNSDSAPNRETLRQFEEWVLVTSNHFPSWSKLPIVASIGVYLLLSVVSVYLPRLRLIHRLGVARRYLALTSSALVVVASFTFFSAHAFQDRADDIVTQLTAQFRDSKQREANEVAQYLAYEAVARSVRHITPPERQFYAVFVDVLSAHDSGMTHLQKFDVATTLDEAEQLRDRQVGRGIFGAATTDMQLQREPQLNAVGDENPAAASSESGGNSSHADTIDNHHSLDVQLQRELQLKAVRDQKLADAQDGLKKALSEVIGFGTDMLRERAFSLFQSLGLAVQPDLAKEVETYLGKVSDDALDSKLEPYVSRFATVLSDKISQSAQRSVAPDSQRSAAKVALVDACVTAARLDIEGVEWASANPEAARKLREAREILDMEKEVRAGLFESALPQNMKSRLAAIDSDAERATERYDSVTRGLAEGLKEAREVKLREEVKAEPLRIP